MAEALRKSGIAVVGEKPWGTHFCHFYETKEDLLDVVVPYFKAGLESNELCLWAVLYPLTEEDAKNALRAAVPQADRSLSTGDIEIVRYSQWYLKDGAFDVERVINACKEKLREALAKGHSGLRLTANETWPLRTDWKEFSQYERKLEQLIANEHMMVLCSYPVARAGATHAFEVARVHQFAIAKRQGDWEILKSMSSS